MTVEAHEIRVPTRIYRFSDEPYSPETRAELQQALNLILPYIDLSEIDDNPQVAERIVREDCRIVDGFEIPDSKFILAVELEGNGTIARAVVDPTTSEYLFEEIHKRYPKAGLQISLNSMRFNRPGWRSGREGWRMARGLLSHPIDNDGIEYVA